VFLDHFSIKSLSDLPTLAAFKDIETQDAQLRVQLALENSNLGPENSEVIPTEREALLDEEENKEESILLDKNELATG
jgi:hypothetical protein